MTYKSLRPGGGRGVFRYGSERIGSDRKVLPALDLGDPASVPRKFTDLVNIPGWRVFRPDRSACMSPPPSPSLHSPCPFVHWPPVHYPSQRIKRPRPDDSRPGLGWLPTLATLQAYPLPSPLPATC
jgi:hypothetical protein